MLNKNAVLMRRMSAAIQFTGRPNLKNVRAPLRSLSQVGIESFYVVINSERGYVTPDVPANVGGFNHVVLAIKLPANVSTFRLWLRSSIRVLVPFFTLTRPMNLPVERLADISRRTTVSSHRRGVTRRTPRQPQP